MKRRECLAGRVERSITGEDLITELNRLSADRGAYPAVLRCDNGPELACAPMADGLSDCISSRPVSLGAMATSSPSTPGSGPSTSTGSGL
jgi:hypothetical protein